MSTLKKSIKSILLKIAPGIIKSTAFEQQRKFSWETVDSINNEPEVLILEEYFKLNPEAVFFDIGANKGEYLFAAEKFLKPNNIYAFEPNPKLFQLLKDLFKGMNIFPYALSSEEKKAKFKIPTINGNEDDTLGNLAADKTFDHETSSEIIEVQCMQPDSFILKHQLKNIDIIKIDVEGFELDVLKGLKNTISVFFPLMLIEVEKRHHNNRSVLDLLNEIKAYAPEGKKYAIFYFNNLKHQIERVLEEPNQDMNNWGARGYTNNFLFVPEGQDFIKEIEYINVKLASLY